LSYEETELSKSIDLIDVECGAHYQIVDTDVKGGKVLLECLKCHRIMIVTEFKPTKAKRTRQTQPQPDEIDARSDQEIASNQDMSEPCDAPQIIEIESEHVAESSQSDVQV